MAYRHKRNRRRIKKRREPSQTKNPQLTTSSLVLVTNVIIGIYTKNYFYAFLFALLTMTSLAIHSGDPLILNILDKQIIFAVFLHGLYCLYNTPVRGEYILRVSIVLTFLFCIWVYCYGYIYKMGCFDPNLEIRNQWHSMMHVIGTFGHSMILFL
jgi:hypothetical protein